MNPLLSILSVLCLSGSIANPNITDNVLFNEKLTNGANMADLFIGTVPPTPENTTNSLEKLLSGFSDEFQSDDAHVNSIDIDDLPSKINNLTDVLLKGKESLDHPSNHHQSSLAFVFDATGSMWDDLVQLRKGAAMILEAMLEREDKPIYNYILVPFRDPLYGPVTVTTNHTIFKDELEKLSVYGGGDCPEMSLTGVKAALNASLPFSYIYVFTDATAADHLLVNGVLDLVQRKQSQIVFVLTGDCKDRNKPSYQVYEQIAAASSGQVFHLGKTDVYKILQFVKDSLDEHRVNLGSIISPEGYDRQHNVAVDDTIKQIMVSVAGTNPQIVVVDPSGKELNGPPAVVPTLDLSKIKVVTIVHPEPGNWTITVGSEDKHSVKVTGISDVTFQHGFSVQSSKSLKETSRRPLQGAENILLIEVKSGKDDVSKLTSAELLTTSGRLIFELPLMELDQDEKLYRSDVFLPPQQFFYLAVNGFDKNGYPIHRIGPTAVQPQLPEKPFLTMIPEVLIRMYSSIVLECEIESLVPMGVTWFKDGRIIHERQSFLQSTIVEYEVRNATLADEGSYTCRSANIAGSTVAQTVLKLIASPPVINVSKSQLRFPPEGNATIEYDIMTDYPLNSLKLFYQPGDALQEEEIKFTTIEEMGNHVTAVLFIDNINKNDNGSYTCVANNRGGSSKFTINLEVLPILKIKAFPPIVEYMLTGNITFYCEGIGADTVEWYKVTNNESLDELTDGLKFIIGNFSIAPDRVLTDLNIVNATKIDEGAYICYARRGSELVNATVKVLYVEPPTVQIRKEDNLVQVGGDAVFECMTEGKPSPRIVWMYKNDSIISEKLNHIKVSPENKLHIRNVTIKDVGTYICVVENQLGKVAASVFLEVWQHHIPIEVPTDRNITFGSSLQLNCNISSIPSSSITWQYNDRNIDKGIFNNGITLLIDNINLTHSGIFKCIAKNKHEISIYEANVGVIGLEQPIVIKGDPVVSVKNGEKLVVPCSFSHGKPIPKLYWEFNRKNLKTTTDSPSGVYVDKDNSLLIDKVTPDHEGNYSCIGENVLGKDVYDIVLEVYRKPIMPKKEDGMMSDFPLEAKIGDLVSLKCEAYGKPKPLVTWSKDGMPVVYDNILYLGRNDSLIIAKAREMDTGVYSCYAENPLGAAEKRFTLIILVPPIISNDLIEPVLRATEGQLVTLPCMVRAKPKPQVRWLKNEALLEKNDRKQIDMDHTLRFVANVTDSGIYQCEASNKAGNATQEIVLLIFVPPSIHPKDNEDVAVAVGNSVSFECNTIGFPEPSITWSKDGVALKENTTHINFNNLGNLHITNVSEEHCGMYMCSAENNAGFTQKVFSVILYEPPKIITEFPTEVTVITGEKQLRIPCKAEGNPTPFVTWLKDDIYLINSNNIHLDKNGDLLLLLPTEKIKGIYTCEASNLQGADRRSYTIDVLAPPTMVQGDQRIVAVVTIEGDKTVLECPVGNTPSLQRIQWFKGTISIPSAENKTSLTFTNVSRSDESEYSCQASNAAGIGTVIFRLAVEWKPLLTVHRYDELISSDYVNLDLMIGDDLELNCTADADPAAEVKWYKESLVNYGGETLEIKNISTLHSGNYSCIAANYLGSASQNFRINVFDPPRIRGQVNENIYLKSGDRGILQCAADGVPNPSIMWIFSDLSDWRADPQNPNKLMLERATQKSQGNYTCHATNMAGKAEKLFTVTVLEGGKLDSIMSYYGENNASIVEGNVTVKIDDQLRLSCSASGSPPPSIQWISNGISLTKNDRTESSANLVFDKIVVEDSRDYSCLVRNDAGFEQRDVFLNVLVPPKISHSILPSEAHFTPNQQLSMEVLEGQPFKLRCHATGNPAPDIYWFKDRKFMVFYDGNMLTRDGGELLVVLKSIAGHAGNYSCVARNSVGEDTMNYHVDILVPPSVEIKDHLNGLSVTAKVGHEIHMECPVIGSPRPSIRWLKHPYTEIDDSNARIVFDQRNGSLIIRNATLDDTGRYSCLASNSAGSRDLIYTVKVVQAPTIAEYWIKGVEFTHGSYGYIIKAKVKRSFQLRCDASGFPEPKISWIKDGMPLYMNRDTLHVSLDGRIITITDAQLRDTGIYTCHAENEAGFAHATYELTVLVPSEWGPWSDWSECSTSCGLGLSVRRRICNFFGDVSALNIEMSSQTANEIDGQFKLPNEVLDKSRCRGNETQTRECNATPCQVDGEWSVWSDWTTCSNLCGPGTKRRYRYCNSPAPRNGGLPCTGADSKQASCEGTSCFEWNLWSSWSSCSVTCGSGIKFRERKCPGPHTSSCPGNSTESVQCNMPMCPVNGDWSDWSEWSACNPLCRDQSQRYRTRKCNNPKPKFHGLPCIGANIQVEKCATSNCTDFSSNQENTINPNAGNLRSNVNHSTASLVITGNLNGVELPQRRLEAQITEKNGKKYVNASINDILQDNDSYLPFITFMVSPIDLDDTQPSDDLSSYELDDSLFIPDLKQSGNDDEEDIQFLTGEEVKITRKNFSQTEYGDIKIEITVDGTIPKRISTANSTVIIVNHKQNTSNNTILEEGGFNITTFDMRDGCRIGFVKDHNGICEDLNECELSTNACHATQMCENMIGSYNCLCQDGYVSTGIGQRCLDVNECIQDIHECSHQCINVAGGYLCLCPPDLTLSIDKKTCINVDSDDYWPKIFQENNISWSDNKSDSIVFNHPESNPRISSRKKKIGKYNPAVFRLVKPYNPPNYEEYEYSKNDLTDGVSLEDFPYVDREANNVLHRSMNYKGHNSKRGHNVIYSAEDDNDDILDDDCPTGFYKDDDTCQDIDECSVGLHTCSDISNACINTEGAYMCLPTPCPDFYDRMQDYRKCEQKCDVPDPLCSEKAALSQYVIYIIKSFSESSQKMPGPILDLDYGGVANNTDYILDSQPNGETFEIETKEFAGVLSTNTTPSYKHINRLIVTSTTYDTKGTKLLYFTRYIIYLYITE